MRILMLGGTSFIGPHVIRSLLADGHDVALFNRGQTAPQAFEELQRFRGDRKAGDYVSLEGGTWDVVIDTCAYWPRAVRQTLEAIGDRVGHYLFVSTISVYDRFDEDGYDEGAPLATVEDPESEDVSGGNYGGLKVLCERELDAFAGLTTIVRPGLVAGPGDTTDRFTYWPVRFARGGEALVPGRPEHPIQYIDVRDLAAFVARLVRERAGGVFNVVTPRGAHDMGELVEECRAAATGAAEAVWVEADFLHAQGVRPWGQLPLWVPPGSRIGGIPHCSSERAVAAGLTFRPLRDTVRDTLQWFESERGDELAAGLPPQREAELLRDAEDTR